MTREELKKKVNDALVNLEQTRDELRVNAHLARMEAKDRWDTELEPRLRQAERLAREIAEDIHKRVEQFRASSRTT